MPKTIKEASTKKEVNSYLTEDGGDIVTLMEKEWPEIRMNDKLQRVKNLLMSGRENAVNDEPLEDAYLDVSNYGIMATLVGRGKWGK